MFSLQSRAFIFAWLNVHNFFGFARPSILTGRAGCMLRKSPVYIITDSGIERAIRTFQNVHRELFCSWHYVH